MDEEKECSESLPPLPQRERQQISVPFLWEVKPGMPRKDWISKALPLISFPSPAKLVVSVPFGWEEKPGKPLLQLSNQPFLDPLPLCAPPWLCGSPPAYSRNPFVDGEDEGAAYWGNPFVHDKRGTIEENSEAFSFNMDDDASGCVLWDHLLTTPTMSSVIAEESYSEDGSARHETWYSVSETDRHSSSSSTATQNARLDASLLEFLFPLPPPDTGFLNKVFGLDGASTAAPQQLRAKTNCSSSQRLMPPRTMTLGELILLSRKLSRRRKPIEVEKRSSSMELLKKSLFACFAFSISSNKSGPLIGNW